MFRILFCIIIFKVFITQLDACVNLFVNSSKNKTISKTFECNASKIHFEYSEGENLLLECSTNVTSSSTFLEFDGTVEWIESRIVKNITFSEPQNNTVLKCALREIRNDSFPSQLIDFGQVHIIFHMKVENYSNNLMLHATEQSTLDLFPSMTLNISSSNLTIVKDPTINPVGRLSTILNTVPNTIQSLTPSSEISTLPTTPLNIPVDSKLTKNVSINLSVTPSPMPGVTYIFTTFTKPFDKQMSTSFESTDLSSDLATMHYKTTTLSLSITEQDLSLVNFDTPSNLVASTSTSTPTDENSIITTKSSSLSEGLTSTLDTTWTEFVNTNLSIFSSTTTTAMLEKQSHPDSNMPVTPTRNLTFLSTISSNTTIEKPPTYSSTFLGFLDVFSSFLTPTLSSSNGTLSTSVAGSNSTSSITLSPISAMNTEELTAETTETLDKPLQSVVPTQVDKISSTLSIPNGSLFSNNKSTKAIEKQLSMFFSTNLDTIPFKSMDALTTTPISTTDTRPSTMDTTFSFFTSITSSNVTLDTTLFQNFSETTEEQPSTDLPKPMTSVKTESQPSSTDVPSPTNPILDINFSTSTTPSNVSLATIFSTYYVPTSLEEMLNITTLSTLNITTTTEKQTTVAVTLSNTETSTSTTFTSFGVPTLPMTSEKNQSAITEVTPLLSTTVETDDTEANVTSTPTISSTYTMFPEILANVTLVTLTNESPSNILNGSSSITTNSATTVTELTSVSETLITSSPILSTVLSTTISPEPFTSKTTDNIKLVNVTSSTENSTEYEEDKRKNHLPDLKTLLIVFVLMLVTLSCSFFAIYRMVEQNTRKNVPKKNLSNNSCPEIPPTSDQLTEDYLLFENRSDNTSSSTISMKEFPEELYSKPLPKIQRVKRKDESIYANRNISNKNSTFENIPMETMYSNTSSAIHQQQRPNDSNWIYSNQVTSRNEPPKDVYAQIKPKRYRNQPTYINIPTHMKLEGLDTAQSLYNDPLDN